MQSAHWWRWRQHLGLDLPRLGGRPIWIHACSVGEVASVAPLVRALLARRLPVHISTVTATGMQHALRLFGDTVSAGYLPWDLPGAMARLVEGLNPRVLLLTETEFWPGMLAACKRRNVPVIGINTRISDRSFPRYLASRWLWRRWLAGIAFFCAQSELDGQRLAAIGVDAGRILYLGNLKYAISPPLVDATKLRCRLDAGGSRPILIAASTHAGEDEILLDLLPGWRRLRPGLLLVLVPRHPERFAAVAEAVEQRGLHLARWSQDAPANADVVLIDAMGLLAQLYAIADLAFIGGSLVPFGGHNPLEAAVCGRGVITGPHIMNFRGIMAGMEQSGAAIVAGDRNAFDAAVRRLLSRPQELSQLHRAAAALMQNQAGVLNRVLAALSPYLEVDAA